MISFFVLLHTLTTIAVIDSSEYSGSSIKSVSPTYVQAQQLFYESVNDKDKIDPAIALFEQIQETEPALVGRAQTYIGTLIALKGKHAFMPYNKYKWVIKGLEIMDQGVAADPDDVESLFIHSSTCYYLPFFFNRGEDAQQKFRQILELLPDQFNKYNASMLLNVLDFIENNGQLNANEIGNLQEIRNKIKAQIK
ncbi:hypothetical protein JW960_27860 [candidate division KSB1 bacterium]|nr:hypothetical protein [candidate division KSB1 bacterium]